MEKIIGPYKLSRRTEYSKFVVSAISDIALDELTKHIIIRSYEKQIECPEKYFEIEDGVLKRYNELEDIEYIFVPETVHTIGERAFESSFPKYIHLPETITSIEYKAFVDCMRLMGINIPSSVNELGTYAFKDCKMLDNIILPDILEIPEGLFYGCNFDEITIPDTVQYIGTRSFAFCKNLKEINIPKNFKTFGAGMFTNSSITTLVFNHNLPPTMTPKASYGDITFLTSIHKIKINNAVSYIDPNLFAFSSNPIERIIYTGTEDEFEKFKNNNEAFFKYLKDVKVEIRKDLTSLKNMRNESRRESIMYGDSDRSI